MALPGEYSQVDLSLTDPRALARLLLAILSLLGAGPDLEWDLDARPA